MLLYSHHDWRKGVLIEIDNAFKIKFRAKQVEKDVLTIALVHLTALVGQFIEHWEGLRSVRHAWDHLTHA